MKISDLNFDYLKPPKEASSINHECKTDLGMKIDLLAQYIKEFKGNKRKRKIFFEEAYDSFEIKMVQDFEQFFTLNKRPLPSSYLFIKTVLVKIIAGHLEIHLNIFILGVLISMK